MRLLEFFNKSTLLNEGMTFSVARLKVDDKGQQHHDSTEFQHKVSKHCWVCDGTGKEQLPGIMRKLIQLKNQDSSQRTQEPTTIHPKMQKSTDDNGVTHIGKSGATIHNMGRSQSQLDRYIDTLIKMVQFAQKNDAVIGWA